jgi:hypothetical protein
MLAPVSHRSLLAALGIWLLAISSSVEAAELTADSPFMPPSNGAAPIAITEGGVIELHGIMTTSAGTRFSIYDTRTQKAVWVGLNETGLPFVVRSHSIVDNNDQVKVDYQGATLPLALKTAKIASLARAVPGMPGALPGPPNAQLNRVVPVTTSVVPNPTPADDAARLQAVVDAVAARRAARNQLAPPPTAAVAPVAQAPLNRPAQNPKQPQTQNGTAGQGTVRRP